MSCAAESKCPRPNRTPTTSVGMRAAREQLQGERGAGLGNPGSAASPEPHSPLTDPATDLKTSWLARSRSQALHGSRSRREPGRGSDRQW
jgi:hypothetical protein